MRPINQGRPPINCVFRSAESPVWSADVRAKGSRTALAERCGATDARIECHKLTFRLLGQEVAGQGEHINFRLTNAPTRGTVRC